MHLQVLYLCGNQCCWYIVIDLFARSHFYSMGCRSYFYGLVPHAEHTANTVQCCVSCVPKYFSTIYPWSAFRFSCLLCVIMRFFIQITVLWDVIPSSLLDRHQYARLDTLTAVLLKSQVIGGVMPRWLGNSYQRFGGAYCLHLQGLALQEYCLCELLVLGMEATHSSEKLEPLYKTARPHIWKDCHHNSRSCNLPCQCSFLIINHNARFVFKFHVSSVI